MKIIRNNIIPFKGCKAINLFGVLFARKNARIDDVTIVHESIHTAQMREMLYIPYYLWYLIEWFVRLFCKGNAYRNISFEKEAYTYQYDYDYVEKKRKRFAWLKMM